MNAFIVLLIAVLPIAAFAAGTDCRVNETLERYEVVCEGEPAAKTVKPQAEAEEVAAARGKHRPSGNSLESARAARTKVMIEQRQQEANSPVRGEGTKP